MGVDGADCGEEGRVYFVVSLGGEASAEQVEGVGGEGGDATSKGAGDEGFSGLGEAVRGWEGVEGLGDGAVGGELDAAVEDVEEFGGDVAFPEAL